MLKSLTRSIAKLATKFDKFNLPDDYDESSEEEEGRFSLVPSNLCCYYENRSLTVEQSTHTFHSI
jgi:hypothetical protein